MMRQGVFADYDFDVNAEIAGMAEDFYHASDGTGAFLGVFEQLDIDDHAVELFDRGGLRGSDADAIHGRARGRKFEALGDLDPLLNPVVLRNDVLAAAVDAELADYGW